MALDDLDHRYPVPQTLAPRNERIAILLIDLQRRYRLFEIGFWIIYLGTGAVVDSLSVVTEYARNGLPLEPWEPFTWEFSSVVMLGMLIPAVAWLNRSYPFRVGAWRLPLAIHLLATIPFSLIHVGGMVGLRKLTYWLAGGNYDFGSLPPELLYEFRKDFFTYCFILGAFYTWRIVRNRNVVRPDPEAVQSPPVERLIARKGDHEFVVSSEGINWIEASGNYANLHHKDGLFPVRVSMSELEQRLDPVRFARVHRSHIVNLDCVRMIEPTESGDYRIHMSDGAIIRFSRRYRAQLKGKLDI